MPHRIFSFTYHVPKHLTATIYTKCTTNVTVVVDCIGFINNNETRALVTGLHFTDMDIAYIINNIELGKAIRIQAVTEYNNRFSNAREINMDVVQMAEDFIVTNINDDVKNLN